MFLRLGYESGLLLEDTFPPPDPDEADPQHPVNMRTVRALMNRYTKKQNQGWVDYDEFERLLKETWLELHTEESLQAKIMAEMTQRLNTRMLEREASRSSSWRAQSGAPHDTPSSPPFGRGTLQELASTFRFVGSSRRDSGARAGVLGLRRGSNSSQSGHASNGALKGLIGSRSESGRGPGARVDDASRRQAPATDPPDTSLRTRASHQSVAATTEAGDEESAVEMLIRMVSALDAKVQSNADAVARLEALLLQREGAPGAEQLRGGFGVDGLTA